MGKHIFLITRTHLNVGNPHPLCIRSLAFARAIELPECEAKKGLEILSFGAGCDSSYWYISPHVSLRVSIQLKMNSIVSFQIVCQIKVI